MAVGQPWTDIRHLLKGLIKREAPALWENYPDEDDERSGWIVDAVCNTSALRRHLPNIKFHKQKWRQKGVLKREPDRNDVAHLLWRAYRKERSLESLIARLEKSLVQHPALPKGDYLTSGVISSPEFIKSLEGDLNTVEFARLVVIFASLLPREEQCELLATAYSVGCVVLASAFDQEMSEIVNSKSSLHLVNSARTRRATLPTISKHVLEPGQEASLLITTFSDTETDARTKLLALEATTSLTPMAVLVASPRSKIEIFLNQLEGAHKSHEAVGNLRAKIRSHIEDCLTKISSKAGYRVYFSDSDLDRSEVLIKRCEAVDALRNIIMEYGFPHALCEKYRRLSNRGLVQEEVEQIFYQVSSHREWRKLSSRYATDLIGAWDCPIEEGGAELESATGRELAALASSCASPDWALPCAIGIRAALDADPDDTGGYAASLLCESQSTDYCRSILYFLQPDQIGKLKGVHAKRIGALEYIRDAIEFGPIAKLSEPHLWLKDPDVVGKNAMDAVEIIINNSDRLGNGPDIARMLRPAGSEHAARALQAFISAPIGMQGNFKRLRETARDRYLATILEQRSPKVDEINTLIDRLEGNLLAEDIYAEVAALRVGDLESRHMEQLKRYLKRAASVLTDYRSELRGNADAREVALRVELSRVHGKLARTADSGGISWFESELRKILAGTSIPPLFPTFQGSSDPILSSYWNQSHNDWASQLLDIPQLYTSRPLKNSVVMHVSLKHMLANAKPIKDDIVDYLLSVGELKSALAYARRDESDVLEKKIWQWASPQTQKLENKFLGLKEVFGQLAVESAPEAEVFQRHLSRLDLYQAEGVLELLELALNEKKEATEKSEQEQFQIADLLENFRKCGVPYTDSVDFLSLQVAWRELFAIREAERAHLECMLPALHTIEDKLPELSQVASQFRNRFKDPLYWLPADAAADFALFVEDSGSRIARWAESASLMKQEERRALSVLAEWYLQFITELVEGLVNDGDTGSVASALGRVMEVTDSIGSADSPQSSLLQLNQIGEFSSSENDVPASNIFALDDKNPRWNNILPEVIARYVANLDWDAVSDRCLQWQERLQPEDASTLRRLAAACKVFGGHFRLVVQDDVEAALGFLISKVATSCGLSESQRVSLAKAILASAIYVDSPDDLVESHLEPTWAQVISSKGSPLRRGAASEGVANRILSELLLGLSSGALAQAVWDGVSGLQDPAQFRTALLLRLYDLELNDLIGKLVARQEPGAVQRLNHLFELRNVASTRADLVPVAVSVAEQIASTTRIAPLKAFLRGLPVASHALVPELQVRPLSDLSLRGQRDKSAEANLTIVVSPIGLVPEKIEALLLAEDDVSFIGGGVRKDLSSRPIYVPTEFTLSLQLGASWASARLTERPLRIRVRARAITGELSQGDTEVTVRLQSKALESAGRLDDETLLDAYPGVSNTPAIDDIFIGRIDELELLHKLLISARRPSPVLMVGLRRIGKTSLLFALHRRHRGFTTPSAVTLYVSLAERRVELVGARRSVSEVVFGAVVHSLVRQSLSFSDQNFSLCSKVRDFFNGNTRAAREDLQRCFDEESLADSLSALRERIATCAGNPTLRLALLIDEAEALVAAYSAGGSKRLELEQFLQSIRELSQRDENLAFLLAGSNHIGVFAREYKNAFFGSSQIIELAGLKRENAPALVSPTRVAPFIAFDKDAVDYAYDICGGMPQFLWQVGATVSHVLRTGNATRNEVRQAVSILTSYESANLPFKSYEILEPIDSIIGLEDERERDLLWMLLYRVAQSSSLIVEEAATAFVIDQNLLQLDDRETWKRRIAKLAELGVLKIPSLSSVAFQVPIFAEGFRSSRNLQEYNIRHQKVLR